MFQSYEQTHVCFRVLCPFSYVIAHNIGVPWLFKMTVKPDTCLRVMTKKSSFSRFIGVFMSYCPQFWDSKAIYNDLKTQYMLEIYDPRLVVFVFYGRFHELLTMVL